MHRVPPWTFKLDDSECWILTQSKNNFNFYPSDFPVYLDFIYFNANSSLAFNAEILRESQTIIYHADGIGSCEADRL